MHKHEDPLIISEGPIILMKLFIWNIGIWIDVNSKSFFDENKVLGSNANLAYFFIYGTGLPSDTICITKPISESC
jgi:hypothetical protein